MSKNDYRELFDSWNKTKNKWYRENKKSIRELLKKCTNDDSENFKRKIINNISDLDNLHLSNGFYMIFSNEESENKCKIEIDGKVFSCVYRGESSELKDRLTSHLFNSSAKPKYETCLMIEGNNVDLSKDKLGHDWLVVTYGMNRSTSEFRRMFEKAFDDEFGKPIYCKDK